MTGLVFKIRRNWKASIYGHILHGLNTCLLWIVLTTLYQESIRKMASNGTSWTEIDQAVLTSLHSLVRQHDEAEYSSCSTTEALHSYNKDTQHVTDIAFSLLTFSSSSNSSHTTTRKITHHAQISTVLTDLTVQQTGSAGFVWIDLVDLSSLPILARHYDIHDACLRGTKINHHSTLSHTFSHTDYAL